MKTMRNWWERERLQGLLFGDIMMIVCVIGIVCCVIGLIGTLNAYGVI